MVNNILKQSMINEILNQKTIDNNEIINNNKTINNKQFNNEKPINNNDNEKLTNTFVETPICIRSKRAVFNRKSNYNKSFQYSITLSLYYKKVGNNFNRITKIKPYINNFNWNNINFPPTEQGYKQFEMNSNIIALNIYQINNEKIRQLYKSNHTRENQVNLLLLEKNTMSALKT